MVGLVPKPRSEKSGDENNEHFGLELRYFVQDFVLQLWIKARFSPSCGTIQSGKPGFEGRNMHFHATLFIVCTAE